MIAYFIDCIGLYEYYYTVPCRCFALIESTGLEQVASLDRMISTVGSGNHESIMGLGTVGALHSILIQCSPSIFQVRTYVYVYTCMCLMVRINTIYPCK